jgi:S-DNA-T family DNA segregation ATPase FtsK/SpoIIIE
MLAALEDAGRRAGAHVPAIRIPTEVEAAWDDVAAAVRELDTGGRPALYLLDDVDALIARFPDEYQLPFTEQLVRLLRDGPGRGMSAVLTTARMSARVQSLVTLCDSRLLLRLPNRNEHLLAGGDGAEFQTDLLAGAGWWRGHRVQVAKAANIAPPSRSRPLIEFPPAAGLAIVAADAGAVADLCRALLTEAGGNPGNVIELGAVSADAGRLAVGSAHSVQILVGNPAAWQANWSLLAAARAGGDVLFVGCTVAEFRAVTSVRTLPPPLHGSPGGAWMLHRNGELSRVQLPNRH